VLGQEVFSHGVQELRAGGATFVGTEAAFMVPINVGVVEVTSYEETLETGLNCTGDSRNRLNG